VTNVPLVPLLWVGLMLGLAVPIPMPNMPMPIRGAIIMYFMVAGAVVLFRLIGRTSWPLALLLTYALGHVLLAGYPIRPVSLLLLMTMGALLYVEAAKLTTAWASRVGWALLAGAAVQAVIGLCNIFSIFPSPTVAVLALPLERWGLDPKAIYSVTALPWMVLASTEFLARPMGWLTHPNYWGAYMAFAVPVAYVLIGRWAGVAAYGLVALSLSIGPMVSGSLALLLVAWRDLPRPWRRWLVVVPAALTLAVSVAHVKRANDWSSVARLENMTSGRSNIWAAAVPMILERPVFGYGVGSWRQWAVEVAQHRPNFLPYQAHNELVQAQFELGAVGLGLALLWLATLARGVGPILLGDRKELMWAVVAAAAVVNSLGSPTFHMPTQAGVALFAAARLEAARRRA